MSSFTIMVDSNTDLPQNYLDEHGIVTIPIPFHLDGVQYPSGYWQDITDTGFYSALRNGGYAGTSQINPESFIEVFTDYAKKEQALLVITLSSGLSGTYQNAVISLEEVKCDYPNCAISVIDSLNASGGAGLLTTLAVNKRNEGFSISETVAWLEDIRHYCLALFTVDNLMYLHRGGRLSKFSAIAGSIIGIKPILNIAPDGTLVLQDKVRGRKKALETLLDQMKSCIDPYTKQSTIIINHSDCFEDGAILTEMIRSSFAVDEVIITMMGPIIGAHVGPGSITLSFVSDITREDYEKAFSTKNSVKAQVG